MLMAPDRKNWTKISAGAYRLLVECERQPLPEVLDRAKPQYGFEPQEVVGFIAELRGRGILYFDTDTRPTSAAGHTSNGTAHIAFLNSTRRCNLHCPTCFANAAAYPVSDDAALEVWCRIMDKLAESGVSTAIVTGGEPFVRQDIIELLGYARGSFKNVFLNTNGTLLTREICTRLPDLVDRVHVSLDGSTPEIHDYFRGKGNYDKTLHSVRLLKEAGIENLAISPTLTRINIEDLPNMLHLALGLGVSIRTSVFLPVGRGACNAPTLSPTPRQLVDVFRETHRMLLQYSDEDLGAQKNFLGILGGTKVQCGAARDSICVGGDGVVYPCNTLHEAEFGMGSLLEARDVGSLLAGSAVTRMFDSLHVESRASCRTCDVRYFCGGGCVGHSLIVHGSLQAPDPFCSLYRQVLRAQMWTVRGDASLRENIQAMVNWLDSNEPHGTPVEVRWND